MYKNIQQVPQEIKDIDNWTVFNKSKIKLNSFDSVHRVKNSDRLGFLINRNNNMTAIVIKNAIKYGKIKEKYLDFIKSFNKTYIERNNNDITIICYGTWNYKIKKYNDIEIITHNKYIILTGNVLFWKSNVKNCQEVLNSLKEYIDDNV